VVYCVCNGYIFRWNYDIKQQSHKCIKEFNMPLTEIQYAAWKYYHCLHPYNDIVLTPFCFLSNEQNAPEAILYLVILYHNHHNILLFGNAISNTTLDTEYYTQFGKGAIPAVNLAALRKNSLIPLGIITIPQVFALLHWRFVNFSIIARWNNYVRPSNSI